MAPHQRLFRIHVFRHEKVMDKETLTEIPALADNRQAELRRRRLERMLTAASPFLVLPAWELVVRTGMLDSRIFPALSMIGETFQRRLLSGE